HAAQIADAALAVQDPGTFLPLRAVAQQLQIPLPRSPGGADARPMAGDRYSLESRVTARSNSDALHSAISDNIVARNFRRRGGFSSQAAGLQATAGATRCRAPVRQLNRGARFAQRDIPPPRSLPSPPDP